MLLLAKYMRPHLGKIFVCLLLLMAQALCNLALPGLMSDIVNIGIVEMNGQPGQREYIFGIGTQMLSLSLFAVCTAIAVSYLSTQISAKVSYKMRRDMFAKVESFSIEEFSKFSTATLITRTTNDVQQTQNVLGMAIRVLGFAMIMGVGGTILAISKSPSLSWIIGLAVLFIICLVATVYSIAVPKFRLLQKLVDRINLVSREILSGVMVIRAFGNEQYEEKRFEEANTEYSWTNRFVQRVMSSTMPIMTLVMNISTVAIVWVGSSAIAQAQLQIGDMLAFIQYATQIIMAFLMISVMFVIIPRATASAQRIEEVLQTKLSIVDPPIPHKLDTIKGEIQFKNVHFKYHDAEEDVLHNISFTAKPGETTAIIGSTGSGKSTLINLVPRFYDVTAGAIELDGIDIRLLSQSQLHNAIGYIPQNGILFSGTVASNLLTGNPNANEKLMNYALTMAQAKDFVEQMPEGIDSDIAQGGANVSGGQKQRLAIARALIKNPPIYIFDDSFSALDFQTDAKLRRELNKKIGNATIIIVAQRVNTIKEADQIIVLDEGKVTGIGRHEELLAANEQYREIAQSQMNEEVPA